MTKPVLMLMHALSITLLSFGQIKVPGVVKNAFNARFPGATSVTWGRENAKEYEAEFIFSNAAVAANFKEDGSWLVTETTILPTELSPSIKNTINGKYHGSIIIRAEKVERPGAKMYYEVIINNASKRQELKLNENGSFLK